MKFDTNAKAQSRDKVVQLASCENLTIKTKMSFYVKFRNQNTIIEWNMDDHRLTQVVGRCRNKKFF